MSAFVGAEDAWAVKVRKAAANEVDLTLTKMTMTWRFPWRSFGTSLAAQMMPWRSMKPVLLPI